MVMIPAVLGTKYDCSGEGQQHFTPPTNRLKEPYEEGWRPGPLGTYGDSELGNL